MFKSSRPDHHSKAVSEEAALPFSCSGPSPVPPVVLFALLEVPTLLPHMVPVRALDSGAHGKPLSHRPPSRKTIRPLSERSTDTKSRSN